jgi:UDP-N-acetylmuramate dehydrogenase
MNYKIDSQTIDLHRHLPSHLRGVLKRHEPMAKHTSWKTGGMAQWHYVPADLADLQAVLAWLDAVWSDCPIYCMGLGSNVLVRAGELTGVVLGLHDARYGLRDLRVLPNGNVYAQAGVASPKLARFVAIQHQAGAAFLAGIPGAVGGALAMNAGCYGAETWTYVQRVWLVNRRGELIERNTCDFDVGYRHVQFKPELGRCLGQDEWFVAAEWAFPAGDEATERAKIKNLLQQRIATQPLNLPNCGSVFRNPPNDYAARLIESCHLKGYQIGGAEVSSKHANFIVNPYPQDVDLCATPHDIEALIAHVQRTVLVETGVQLVPEVRVVG